MAERHYTRMSGIQYYLEGMEYPAERNRVTQVARNNNAPEEVIRILQKLEDNVEYRNADELDEHLGVIMDEEERRRWKERPEPGRKYGGGGNQ